MKLKTAVFYQSVKNWDGNESNTFKHDPTQIIELEDHLVKVSKEGRRDVIIVPTANLRYATADYLEAYKIVEPQPSNLSEIASSSPEPMTKESLIKPKKKIEKAIDA
jgi:peptidase E